MFFYIFSWLSWLVFAIAGVLFYIHFTDTNPGMIMTFLIPLLIGGLFFGIVATILRFFKQSVEKPRVKVINLINYVLLIAGIIGLIYSFQN